MFEILNIDESFNNQMLQIIKETPIEAGGLKLLFDKSPDLFHISRMKHSKSEHLGFFLKNEMVGFASLGFFPGFVDGELQQLVTFYNFYLKPEARGRGLVERAMKEFFARIGGQTNFGYSVTLKGNRPVEAYAGNHVLKWMPPTRIIDELVVKTILLSFPKKNKTSYNVRTARTEDIPEIARLLNAEFQQRDFAPEFPEETFLDSLEKRGLTIDNYFIALNPKGEVKGVCLAWDCSSFRRTKVIEYSSSFYPVLGAYKMLEKVFPMAPFPGKDVCFNELTLTDCAVSNRNPEIMHALLCEIYHRNLNRKYHFMNFASCAGDNLLQAAKGFWNKEIRSHIIFASIDPKRFGYQPKLPYIDIAFL